jgi:uncharacterized protein (TIGR02246 family)
MKKITVLLMASVALSCSAPKVDTNAEGEKIIKLSEEWSKSASKKDVEKIVSYWADDAVLISAGQPPLEGKAAIRQMVEESFKTPGFGISWQPKKAVVSESGDMAYIIEDAQTSFTDSTGKVITMQNQAVSIWRKQADGSWKNVVDISTPKPSN